MMKGNDEILHNRLEPPDTANARSLDYVSGVFTAIFVGLYVRRTTEEWSSFWELKSYVFAVGGFIPLHRGCFQPKILGWDE